MPARETRPNVGLIPTSEHAAAGQTIEPSVSVPTPTAAKFAASAAAVPELEPQGLRSSTYGFLHWPPRALHPLEELLDRKLAHSERFAFPSMTAPAARSRAATPASAGGFAPTSASEPAVVAIRSAVAMLSLMRIGMPCRGPRGPFVFRSASRFSSRTTSPPPTR